MDIKCIEFERAFSRYQAPAASRSVEQHRKYQSGTAAISQEQRNSEGIRQGEISVLNWSTNVMPIIQMGIVPVAIDCESTTLKVFSQTLAARLASSNSNCLFLSRNPPPKVGAWIVSRSEAVQGPPNGGQFLLYLEAQLVDSTVFLFFPSDVVANDVFVSSHR